MNTEATRNVRQAASPIGREVQEVQERPEIASRAVWIIVTDCEIIIIFF